jgi:hypothetical protein
MSDPHPLLVVHKELTRQLDEMHRLLLLPGVTERRRASD